jgi:hypothetical protein
MSAGDLFDRQDLVVELSRSLDVGDGERDVMNRGDFHTGNRQSTTSSLGTHLPTM